MNFSYDIGLFHGLIFVTFFLIYLALVVRYWRVSRVLKVSVPKFVIKFFLRLTYLILLVVASLGPHVPEANTQVEVKDVGKDIFFALDLSKSMNVDDVPPSRIERAKHELLKIAKAFATDRLGLIIFSENAYLQCPLTFDKSAFQLYLENTSTDLVPTAGTNFASALNMALSKQTANDEVENKAKIVVLVSDGEDFGEETIDAAKELKEEGIKLFTVGMGTSEGGKIKSQGRFVKDKKGNVVVSKLNSKSLKKLASLTGGKYYEVSKTLNQTSRVIRDIKKIKGISRDKIKIDAPKNSQFEYFLIPALFLILIDFIFSFKLVKI